MKFQKFLQLGVVFTFALSLVIPSVSAATPMDALVKVSVIDASGNGEPVPVPNAYVNMYDITLVNNEYTGVLVATMPTGNGSATFTVKSGEVVDFMAFGSKDAAEKQKAFASNGVPPLKNFSADDGIAGVCHTNGVDFSKKLESVSATCFANIQVGVTGPLPVATPSVKGKNVTYKVQVIEKMNEQSNDQVVLPYQYVNMYAITVVNNEYTGTLLKTMKTGKKTGASFKVKPGQVVDFRGYSTKTLAKAAKDFVSNGVPPMKNFSPLYAPGLCHTNGVDFAVKLDPTSNTTMCGKKGITELVN